MPLLGTGFSLGTSGVEGGIGKSLDDLIADRRKEQIKAASGRGAAKKNTKAEIQAKKTATADRSIATGKAKRAAAARARRGLSNNNNSDNKPSAMEVEKEVYRQSRKTADSKKRAEQKKAGGRLPPAPREKKTKAKEIDPPGAVLRVAQPRKNQIEAALKGMKDAKCPVPKGYQMIMQFIPIPAAPVAAPPAKGKTNANNNNNNNNNKKKAGGRGGRGGKK